MFRFHILGPLYMLFFYVLATPSLAQYIVTKHRLPNGNEVPVRAPGSYAKSGTTYILMNDISSATSPIFLGKDITLDLNGYTIKYAAGNYQHIFNSGFEEGGK